MTSTLLTEKEQRRQAWMQKRMKEREKAEQAARLRRAFERANAR